MKISCKNSYLNVCRDKTISLKHYYHCNILINVNEEYYRRIVTRILLLILLHDMKKIKFNIETISFS